MDLFWDGALVLLWFFFTYKLVTGRIKWFWFLIWVVYTMIATSMFIFLDVSYATLSWDS